MKSNQLTEIFLLLFTEKNSDGTRNLRLRGRELFLRKGIEDGDMPTIAEFLLKHDMIVKLDLCYNNIGDEGLEIFTNEYLSKENNLQTLILVGCNIGANGMRAMAKAKDTIKLQTLRLTGNKIGKGGAQYICDLLYGDSTLAHLDVGDCDQSLSTIPLYASALRADIGANTNLRVLDLSRLIPNHCMQVYDGLDLVEQMAETLKRNNSLTEIHLQKNGLDGHDVEILLMGLRKNNSLLMLDLAYNNIGDLGFEHLAGWLRERPNLLGLNVAGNKIGDNAARAFGFGLAFSKIRLLDISHNNIEDDGITSMLFSMKKSYRVELFFLFGNKIGDKTLQKLTKYFQAKLLNPQQIDIKIYTVDDQLQYAYNPIDHFKQRYYCVLDHGVPVELRIRRNRVEVDGAQPRARVKSMFYDRIPTVDFDIPAITDLGCCGTVMTANRKPKQYCRIVNNAGKNSNRDDIGT